MDFEDDPDYEDEDEDNIYDFAQERDKSLNKYREPVEEDISYEDRASPDIWWTQTTLKIKEENQWAQY